MRYFLFLKIFLKGSYSKEYHKLIYSLKDYDLRNCISFREYAKIGSEKIPKNGVKGQALVSKIVDFPRGIPIDYMHLLCLGIFKSIMNLWFDSSNRKFDYYLGRLIIL